MALRPTTGNLGAQLLQILNRPDLLTEPQPRLAIGRASGLPITRRVRVCRLVQLSLFQRIIKRSAQRTKLPHVEPKPVRREGYRFDAAKKALVERSQRGMDAAPLSYRQRA